MKGSFEHSSGFTKICALAFIVLCCSFIAIAASTIYLSTTRTDNETTDMRGMLAIQNLFLFILSPVIAQHFLWKEPITKVFQLKELPFLVLLSGSVAMIAISPLIDTLTIWNQGLHLPEALKGVEQWMINSEKQADVITKKLLTISSWGGFLMNIIVVAILAGLGEELLFRGTLQKILIGWTRNSHAGILITAFIFSAIHLQFFGFFPRFLLGALLGYLYLWSGSLWIPIIAHTLNNALIIIFTKNSFNEGNYTIEYINNSHNSLVLTIVSLIVVAICMWYIWLFYKKKQTS